MRDWIRQAPTALLITLVVTTGVIVVSLIAGYIYLLTIEADTTDFRAFMNTLMNAAAILITSVAAVGSVSAAKAANKVQEATNGGLDKLVEKKIAEQVNDNG